MTIYIHTLLPISSLACQYLLDLQKKRLCHNGGVKYQKTHVSPPNQDIKGIINSSIESHLGIQYRYFDKYNMDVHNNLVYHYS
mmetsp:Transcript_28661/g.32786  ORF Transcript_28661/g.32786 Transcript_28661/m.32786 type:complete len:83 (-) Transcript_28661:1390-1638(-)